jgi:hypothetical protein
MMTMVQRLDAGSFFLDPLLSVFIFLALVLKVCLNRFSCHGQSVAELAPPKPSNFWPLGDISWVAKKRCRVQPIAGLDPAIRDCL